MLLLWAAALGLALGWLRGGRLAHLAQVPLRGIPLVFAALIVQLLIFPLGGRAPLIPWATEVFHLISYALLVGFVVWNRHLWPIGLMGLGMLLNLIAIWANGGRMPARAEALLAAGKATAAQALLNSPDHTYANNVLMGPDTRFNLLGDWLYLPAWVPLANAFSPGDLLLGLGLVWFLQRAMRPPPRSEGGSPGM